MDGKGGLSTQTVLYHHYILFESLSHDVKMGLLGRNVAEAVAPPCPEQKNMVTLAAEDVSRFLEAGHANCIAPHKRPYHTIIPAMGFKDGNLFLLQPRRS